MTTNNEAGNAQARDRDPGRFSDEISIGDLVADIVAQWKVLVGTVALFAAVAGIYDYLAVEKYRYTIDLEVGQSARTDLSREANFIMVPPADLKPPLLESLGAVSSRLETSWLPELMEDTFSNPGARKQVGAALKVSNPDDPKHDDSRTIRISTTAPLKYEDSVLALLLFAGLRVSGHHAKFLEQFLQREKRDLETLTEKLEKVQSEAANHARRIKKLQQVIESSPEGGLGAAVELNALLPEMRNLDEEEARLRESAGVKEHNVQVLSSAVDAFSSDELDTTVLDRQRAAAAALKTSLSIEPTRVMGLPGRSAGPVGVDSGLILMLATVVGVGVGLVLAIVVQAVRREKTAQS